MLPSLITGVKEISIRVLWQKRSRNVKFRSRWRAVFFFFFFGKKSSITSAETLEESTICTLRVWTCGRVFKLSIENCLYWRHKPKHDIRRYGKKKPRGKSKSNWYLKHAAREFGLYIAYMSISSKENHHTSRGACSCKGQSSSHLHNELHFKIPAYGN